MRSESRAVSTGFVTNLSNCFRGSVNALLFASRTIEREREEEKIKESRKCPAFDFSGKEK